MPNENVYTEAHGFKFPNGTTIPIEDAEARQDISEIKQSLSQLGELIWTNKNPSNTFAGQTLNNLDLSKYSFLLVVYKRWINNEDYEANIIYKDKKCLIKSLAEVLNYRSAECTNTSITWSDSNDYQTYGSSTKTVQNNRNVPYKIFGLF